MGVDAYLYHLVAFAGADERYLQAFAGSGTSCCGRENCLTGEYRQPHRRGTVSWLQWNVVTFTVKWSPPHAEIL